MIDIVLIAILGLVTWSVANEGPWGAAYVFLSVLIAGILTMNLFEPVASALGRAAASYEWQHYVDVIAYLGLFSAAVFGLRTATDQLMPTYVEIHALAHDVARWTIGLATGYLTMAILLTALHVAPLPREFMGFTPERRNLFHMRAPDREWLAFNQFISMRGLSTASGQSFDVFTDARIPGRAETSQYWSSFPIRYATRREQFSTGGRTTGGAVPGLPGAAPGAIPGAPAAPVQPVPAPFLSPPNGNNQPPPGAPSF